MTMLQIKNINQYYAGSHILLALKSDRRSRATLFWRPNSEDDQRIESILQVVRLSPLRPSTHVTSPICACKDTARKACAAP